MCECIARVTKRCNFIKLKTEEQINLISIKTAIKASYFPDKANKNKNLFGKCKIFQAPIFRVTGDYFIKNIPVSDAITKIVKMFF